MKPNEIASMIANRESAASSRRQFLGHAGALGLGASFLAASGRVVRAADGAPKPESKVNGLIFEKFEAGGISHYSYFIGDGLNGTAVVIDPKRDVDDYLALAEKHRLKITHVLETHVHADFVSGLRELVDQSGATGCASIEGGTKYGFSVQPLRDGDVIKSGNIRLKALHTPGHTPEHMSYLASTRSQPENYWAIFTGDFLFEGAVGRPDLMGVENTGKLARKLWHSVQNAFTDLPGALPIYPAHGPGSPCGAGITQRDGQATLATERKSNPAFEFEDREKFIENLLWEQPPVPYYWPRMKEINSAGPEILGSLPEAPLLEPGEFRTAIDADDVQLLDTRSMFGFGGGHIPGALNIGYSPSISMWGGWLIDHKRPVAIVTPGEGDPQEVVRWLTRIGVTEFNAALKGGMKAWSLAAGKLADLPQLPVQKLRKRLDDPKLQVLDVRMPAEWDTSHLPGAQYMFLPEIPERMGELDKSRPVATYCGTGYRASIAASLLKRGGFDVRNVPGSFDAWTAEEYRVVVPKKDRKASNTKRA